MGNSHCDCSSTNPGQPLLTLFKIRWSASASSPASQSDAASLLCPLFQACLSRVSAAQRLAAAACYRPSSLRVLRSISRESSAEQVDPLVT